ncbi:GNAT family N-acetyltransferase [Kribbella solani]|uniref:GNAT family N-acetyltransferase n=1 Tax=Kribbella solani TaxID=236067 RepID=UPI0029AC190B|nr:GNAT family N-acetyltransferase [Kribbella solani]MDX3003595.1 GNAT family N-acetyltransferase [Kribbella solani]
MTAFSLTRATTDDIRTVTELIAERAAWLGRRGIAQWSKKDPNRDTAATIASGETWVLRDQGLRTIGTITLSTRADHDFWSRAERSIPAIYTSKIATRLDCAGLGHGQLLLHAAFMYARRRGLSVLRWDVWRTNQSLQAYYRSLGANLLRVVEVPGRSSGALFEWRAIDRAVWQSGAPERVTVEAPEGEICRISAATEHTFVRLGADRTDRLQSTRADHVHRTLELHSAVTEQPLLVGPTEASPSILFHAGDNWRVGQDPVAGPLLKHLQPGLVYRITHDSDSGSCHVSLRGDLIGTAWHPQNAIAPFAVTQRFAR